MPTSDHGPELLRRLRAAGGGHSGRTAPDVEPRPDELSCLLRRIRLHVLDHPQHWGPETLAAGKALCAAVSGRLRAMDPDPWPVEEG